MPQVVVRPGESDEYTIPFTHGWERRQIVGRMRRLLIDVPRAEAKAADLTPKRDTITLDGVDTVILTDIQTGGSVWTLRCFSSEWLANRAGFTSGGEVREGTDQDLTTDLISEVSTWTAGNVSKLTGPLSFVLSHAAPHEGLRRVETNVPGEYQFRDFGTVDYTERLGTDRSGSVTLSAAAGTIEGEITITERGRELDGTHIRVLGAHEGKAQLFVNLVPEGDTDAQNALENVVTYATPRWSEDADTDWDRWANNDITDQGTLETEAKHIGEELTESLVKAETTVPVSVGLNVGDTVQVQKDDADLDRSMRVHRLTRRAGTYTDTDSDAAVVDKVHLSTRTTLQTDDDSDLEEIRKFNTGFQGSSVVVNAGPFGKAIDNGDPFTFSFRYPDLEFENTAQLHIRSVPYRVDSQGAASAGGFHSHSVTIPDHNHSVTVPDHNHGYSLSISDHNHDVTIPVPSHTHVLSNPGATGASGRTADTFETSPTLENHSHVFEVTGQIFDFNAEVETSGDGGSYFQSTTTDNGGGTTETTTDGGGTTETTSNTTPTHTHDIDPGIFETADTVSNVVVEVNGHVVATNVGSGTFEEVIDVAGEFNADAWNDVRLFSDSLGILEVSAFVEGYDQIGKSK